MLETVGAIPSRDCHGKNDVGNADETYPTYSVELVSVRRSAMDVAHPAESSVPLNSNTPNASAVIFLVKLFIITFSEWFGGAHRHLCALPCDAQNYSLGMGYSSCVPKPSLVALLS